MCLQGVAVTDEFPGCLGILFAELYLPQCHSLKMKRSVIKRIIQKAQNDHNVSVSELAEQDKWQRSTLGFAMIGTSKPHLEKTLQHIQEFIEAEYPGNLVRSTLNFL